jgi:hypothetical protein
MERRQARRALGGREVEELGEGVARPAPREDAARPVGVTTPSA